MKNNKFLLLFLLLNAVISHVSAINTFATSRLQKISSQLTFIQFDALAVGENIADWNDHSITIRVNQWNEIEHIGFKVFNRKFINERQSCVSDFVERYLIELALKENIEAAIQQLDNDDIVIGKGELRDLYQLNDSMNFNISIVGFKGYRIAWLRSDSEFVSITFPMDYQLLSGCNSIELEENYIRNLNRFIVSDTTHCHQQIDIADTTHTYHIEEGGAFLSGAIRNDRYYQKTSEGWSLICEKEKLYWTSFNIALSVVPVGDFNLLCTLDKYGYKTSTFLLPIHKWVDYCIGEGGEAYFGIKGKDSTKVFGTIIVPFEEKGYCHMMKLEIPISAIESKNGTIEGRLYVYVPLHNLYDGYFEYLSVPQNIDYE